MKDIQSLSHKAWNSKYHLGHLIEDHVHMMISISPKCAVTQVVRYLI
jgi:REP element-mobilizing transposase RayT